MYLLFEHQSEVDRLMAFRLLSYLVRIWERWLSVEANHGATTLPVIVPLVLYHGERPWSAPVELRELVDLGDVEALGVEPFLPRLRFLLADLGALEEEALRGRRELTAMARLAQALLRALRREQAVELLSRWVADVRALEQEAGGLSDLGTLVYYVWAVRSRDERSAVEAFMQDHLGKEAGQQVRTILDSYRAEGWEKGREEGLDLGRLEGARRAVIAVLESRELPVSRQVRARLAACADEAQLARWLRRAVKVATAAEIFAP